jgi:6-phosphogluconolactonase (cycloisomerase 2 family)
VRAVVVCLVCLLGALVVPGLASAGLPSVTVSETTTSMSGGSHTQLPVSAACSSGELVGGGAYLRNATNAATVPTNGLVLGGTSPSLGTTPLDTPVLSGATDPSHWFSLANFTGASESVDEAEDFALCATGGTAHTTVVTASTTGANATQQVSPPVLTIATCGAGTTLIGGGAVTSAPAGGQVNDGVTGTTNGGNLKPMGDYPSDINGVPAANGSTTATSWTAYGSAGIPASTDGVTAYALCSTDTSASPVQVARTDVATPDATVGTTVATAAATCPSGTQMTGGGYGVDETVGATSGLQPQQGYHMRGSYPAADPTSGTEVANGASDPQTWEAVGQNGGQSLPSGSHYNLHSYAMCATPAVTPVALSTQASAPVAVGSQISDTAVLSGGTTPSGTITFSLYGPGDTGCATVLATSTLTVTGDGTYQATPVAATQTGTYQWVASYSGDGANPPITGTCNTTGESVTVSAAAPTLSTTAAPALAKTGTALTDTATLSGGDAPTGTIVFSAYQPSQPTCTTAAKTFTVTVNGDGSYTSESFTMTGMVGTYHWIAKYSGDASNAATAGTCGASGEANTLVAATTLSSATSGTVVVGSPISDAATLGGGASPTGTMTFKVFGPGDTACATPLATSTATVNGDGTYNSAPFTTTTKGTYQWIASYGGDANGNAAISGACGATGESDQVTNPPSGASVYVANATNTFGISQYSIATDGTLSTKNPPTATGIHENASGIAVTPNGEYVYGASDELVTEYVVGPGGTLLPNTTPTIPTGSNNANNAEGVAVSPNGTSLYVLNFGIASTVSQYTIAPDGTLSAKTVPSVPTGTTPTSIVVSPNGQYAYVTNGNGITQYTIAADGSLSPNPDAASVASASGIETAGIAESANGANVYINNSTEGTVSQYTVNPDGTLTLASTVATGARPSAVALSPDGMSLYVADGTSPTGSISQYDVSPSGALSPKSPATVTTTSGDPAAIAISSDGHDLFTANDTFPGTASQFTIGAGGLLTADPTATVAAGSQPDGIIATPGPSVSSTASASVPVGGQISDSALLAGGSDPTGTVTFNLYGPGDTGCASSLASSTATASGDGTYQSAAFTADAAGTYQWVASYSGDAGNEAVPGSCGASGESVVVTPGVITGTVTDANGNDLANICVYPFDAATGNRTADAAACSGSNGVYTLNVAAAGSYNLVFYDATGTYTTQWYNDQPYEGLANPVAVGGGTPTTGIDAAMSSLAAPGPVTEITGTVTTPGGAGIPNICVYPFAAASGDRTADPAACTDNNGDYTLTLAAGGTYNLVFYDASGVYPTQWYDGAQSEGQANPVLVANDTTVGGVDAVLGASTQITGTVTNGAGVGIPNICVYAFVAASGNRTADPAACTDDHGNYTLSLSAGGTYNVVFYDPTGTEATQWYSGAQYEGEATPVSVAPGGATTGINAVLAP